MEPKVRIFFRDKKIILKSLQIVGSEDVSGLTCVYNINNEYSKKRINDFFRIFHFLELKITSDK